MSLRRQLLLNTDRVLPFLLAAPLLLAPLAFGGAVWWARPAIAGLVFLFVLGWLLHVALVGEMRVLRSPLTALGVLALGLAALQLLPMPGAIARRISPEARAVYTRGYFPGRVLAVDPGLSLPEPAGGRSPASLDRGATVRWMAGAFVCLALFWGVSQFADRLERLYVVWGCIVAAFFLNSAIALVQMVGDSGGLYGFLQPGDGPFWAPSVGDLLDAPNTAVLRTVSGSANAHPAWAAWAPDRSFQIGTMLGGPAAYLALGALGLPLALALILQLIAPRGSRSELGARLRESGQGSLVGLLLGMLLVSAVLIGRIAGPWFSLPFALGLAVTGLLGARPTGLRWVGLGLTALTLGALGSGVVLGGVLEKSSGSGSLLKAENLPAASRVWRDALPMVRDYPLVGTGMGSFASIFPYYKSRDRAPTTALSSLLQWWVESGAAGMVLLGLALIWCLIRLPGAVRRVGTADRSLVFGLIGAALSFSLYSAVHWTVELTAVAVVASAWGGTLDRWLAGGTDLFVERG